MTDRVYFIYNGSTYNMSVDYIEELLTNAGMSLHSSMPLGIIDKVGYLKTGDDAKQILVDLLAKSGATTNWPFPVSGTGSTADVQGSLDLDLGDDMIDINNIDFGDDGGVDIDLGDVYWEDVTSVYSACMNADRE